MRKTLEFLRTCPEIEFHKTETACEIHVRFTDGYVEHWVYRNSKNITNYRSYSISFKELPFSNEYPDITPQFTRNPLYDDYELSKDQFLIRRKYLDKFKFCNVRIFLHRLAEKLENEGFIQLWYTEELLDKMINSVNKEICKKGPTKYKEVMAHHMKVAPILYRILTRDLEIDDIWNRQNLFVAIDKLYRTKQDITRFNILKILRRSRKIRLDLGYPIAFSKLLDDRFNGLSIINETNHKWMELSAMLSGVGYNNGNGILITDNINCSDKPFIFNGEIDTVSPITLFKYPENRCMFTIIQT